MPSSSSSSAGAGSAGGGRSSSSEGKKKVKSGRKMSRSSSSSERPDLAASTASAAESPSPAKAPAVRKDTSSRGPEGPALKDWEIMQEKTFRNWINSRLAPADALDSNAPLASAFGTGDLLFKLATSLVGPSVAVRFFSEARTRVQRIDRVSQALEVYRKAGMRFDASVENMIDGLRTMVFGFVWAAFQFFVMSGDMASHGPKSEVAGAPDELLEWVQSSLAPYGELVPAVTNYTSCWQDGKAFCGLLHAMQGGSAESLAPTVALPALEAMTSAFGSAHKEFNVPILLDAADMVSMTPDAKSVRMYVSLLFMAARHAAKAAGALKNVNATLESVTADNAALAARLAAVESQRDSAERQVEAALAEIERQKQEAAAAAAAAVQAAEAAAAKAAEAEDRLRDELAAMAKALADAKAEAAQEALVLRGSLSVLESQVALLEGLGPQQAAAARGEVEAKMRQALEASSAEAKAKAEALEAAHSEAVADLSGKLSEALQAAEDYRHDRNILVNRLHGIYDNLDEMGNPYAAIYSTFLTVDCFRDVEMSAFFHMKKQKGKRRWCVLHDNFIFLFASHNTGAKPEEVLRLDPVAVSHDVDTMSFTARHGEATFVFFADTNELAARWVAQITDVSSWWSRESKAHIIAAAEGQNTMTKMVDPRVRKNPAKYEAKLFEAVEHSELARIRDLLKRGVNIQTKTADGLSPLHVAAYRGHDTVISVLLHEGASASAVNNAGQTPLDLAVERNHAGSVELLKLHAKSGEPTVLTLRLIEGDALASRSGVKADPWVVIRYNGEELRSKRAHKTLEPKWHESYVLPLGPSAPDVVTFAVYDHDNAQESFMGEVSLTLPTRPDVANEFRTEPHWYKLKGVPTGRIRVEAAYR